MNRSLSIVAVACFVVGCSSTKPVPAAGPPEHRQVAPQTSQESTVSDLNVAPEIVAACGLPTPHFAFDSAALTPDVGLDALATCFSSGPMQGRRMKLVGHADPRGSVEYNLALGQRRSGAVEGYLTKHGLADSRIASSSRGALDATGKDEASWAKDRRVDVLLGD